LTGTPGEQAAQAQRVDQWLWYARFAKSRTLAQALIERGKVRINRVKIAKTSQPVKPGDVLTLSLGPRIVSVEVLGIGARRGPAAEAQMLYRDLTARRGPPAVDVAAPGGIGAGGRPTKKDRRLIDKIRGRD
jgi:ribosome-associated heat shock protein Hsp15